MDDLLNFHFNYFDTLISSAPITQDVENMINEVREKIKDTFNQETSFHTSACHYVDKKFDEYIESKNN